MSGESIAASLPTLGDFESLFVNNADFEAIRVRLGRFNPIKTMGMERMEIRHSAILGWLLNPQETHGLGDTFLKAFLSEALRGGEGGAKPTALDVSQADLMDAEVRREWRKIDLLVLSPRNGWAFVIENKFDSRQHKNQLARYMKTVEDTFLDKGTYSKVRGVFLTLWDEEPEDDRYAPIQYGAICELMQQHVLSYHIVLAPEVTTFLRHYQEIILEAAGMSEEQKELEKLARELYRDHRKVLDFVMEHGAGSDFAIAARTLFGDDTERLSVIEIAGHEYVFNNLTNTALGFLPYKWKQALDAHPKSWEGCGNWWLHYPLITWFQLIGSNSETKGQLRLHAEVGPLKPQDYRVHLIEGIKANAQSRRSKYVAFRRGATDDGRRFSRFFKSNSVQLDDIQDADALTTAMKDLLKRLQPEIDAIASVLPNILQSWEDAE